MDLYPSSDHHFSSYLTWQVDEELYLHIGRFLDGPIFNIDSMR